MSSLSDFGSNVLLSQIQEAVEAVSGTLTRLPTVLEITREGVKTIMPENMPCIAEFPDEASFNKFLNSVRGIVDRLEISRTPLQPSGRVTISLSVPMRFRH